MTTDSTNGVYKTMTVMLGTALITFVTTWMLIAKDTVKREDFDKLQSEVISLQMQVTRISEHLGIHQSGE